jgi:sugar phosphate permease
MKNSGTKGRTEKGVLAAITSSHLAQHFCVGFSVLYPDIMSDLGLNYTQLGIMSGANSIVSGFIQMLWSLLSRSYAKRVLLGLGNGLTSIGFFVMGASHGFMELVVGNVASGVGQAAQHPVGASMITQKFPREKMPWALSTHYGLGFVGNIVSPVVLSMIAVSFGWRRAAYFLAIIPLIAGLFLLYYLRGEESASR